jgi:hypothetical protein
VFEHYLTCLSKTFGRMIAVRLRKWVETGYRCRIGGEDRAGDTGAGLRDF